MPVLCGRVRTRSSLASIPDSHRKGPLMAFLVSLSQLSPLQGARPHSESECTWRFSSRDGRPVVQLDTYGSPQRKDVGTISQSIQLDETRAAELVAILREAFPAIS